MGVRLLLALCLPPWRPEAESLTLPPRHGKAHLPTLARDFAAFSRVYATERRRDHYPKDTP